MADQDRFAHAVQVVARGLGRLSRERARGGDLTPQQAETLQLVADRGVLSTSALAMLLGIDSSTASRNLTGLEKAGMVQRKKGTDDGRQNDVRLTPRGKRLADAASTKSVSSLAQVLETLPKAERAKVLEGFEIFARAIEPADNDK